MFPSRTLFGSWPEGKQADGRNGPPMEHRKPLRTTESLGVWVTLDVRQRARDDTLRFGYGTAGLSAYVSDLILGQDAAKAVPAAPAAEVALIGSHVVRALVSIDARIREGADGDALVALRAELHSLRGEIATALASCVAEYENRVGVRVPKEDWTGL